MTLELVLLAASLFANVVLTTLCLLLAINVARGHNGGMIHVVQPQQCQGDVGEDEDDDEEDANWKS